MIKLKTVTTNMGDLVLTFEYTRETETVTAQINVWDVLERVKAAKKIFGRQLTLLDLKQIIVQMINELREGKTVLSETFDYSSFIGVDLEA